MLHWMLKFVSSNIPGWVGSSAAYHPGTLAPQSSIPISSCFQLSWHCFLMFLDFFGTGSCSCCYFAKHQYMVRQVLQILAELQALGKSPECARSIAASDRSIGPVTASCIVYLSPCFSLGWSRPVANWLFFLSSNSSIPGKVLSAQGLVLLQPATAPMHQALITTIEEVSRSELRRPVEVFVDRLDSFAIWNFLDYPPEWLQSTSCHAGGAKQSQQAFRTIQNQYSGHVRTRRTRIQNWSISSNYCCRW